jgi:predicted Fe-Mo cluster-binding NifX family protein
MKIAISSTGPDLGGNVDPRFGRCAYFIFYDTETGEWEAAPNGNREAAGGAGIRTAQSVLDRGAEAVITGNIGPNSMQVLSGQVKVYTGFFGTIEEALQAFKAGGMSDTTSATVKDHAGMSGGGGAPGGPGTGAPGDQGLDASPMTGGFQAPGGGMYMGGGMGRGMGMGGGRGGGMGRGRGCGRGRGRW